MREEAFRKSYKHFRKAVGDALPKNLVDHLEEMVTVAWEVVNIVEGRAKGNLAHAVKDLRVDLIGLRTRIQSLAKQQS